MTGQMISRNTLLSDVIINHPESVVRMQEHGIDCVLCNLGVSESVGDASKKYDVDVNELLADLNGNLS